MKLFIWDLHGTLEQGNEQAAITLSNMALQELGYRERFQPEDARKLYGLKWYQYFEALLPNESHQKHVELQARSFELSDVNIALIAKHMRPANHAHEVLEAIHSSHHTQILISNTTPTTVPLFVNTLGIQAYFSKANAFSVNAHTREALQTKEDVLEAYLADKHFTQLIVIGDSETDLRLAKHIGATSYLYAHPGYAFRSTGGDHRVRDLRKVLAEL